MAPNVPTEKFEAWTSEYLSVSEAGMLYALHPQLIPRRHATAHRRARPARTAQLAQPRFASTLETFATVCARLDEFAGTLPEEERQAFALALLGEADSRSLLQHLLAAS